MGNNESADIKAVLNEITISSSLLEKVICVKGTVGDGAKENPIRMCHLYYTTNGVFIGKIIF